MQTESIGIILLAAGASTRLGEPKQLLQFRGETLIRRAVKNALGVSGKVAVAVGANIERIQKEIADLPVQIIESKEWQSGMSSSIRVGLQKLLEDESPIDAVILIVCDQPFVDEKLFAEMIEKFERSGSLIVACEYENTRGVPTLFAAKLFPELLRLDAQTGAKKLIKKYQSQTSTVAFPKGAIDVDTIADYEKLLSDFD